MSRAATLTSAAEQTCARPISIGDLSEVREQLAAAQGALDTLLGDLPEGLANGEVQIIESNAAVVRTFLQVAAIRVDGLAELLRLVSEQRAAFRKMSAELRAHRGHA